MKGKIFATMSIFLLLLTAVGVAQPNGVNEIERGASETKSTNGASSQQAVGGNVTGLKMNATDSTNRWQGFFGNITGEISLEDANNNVLYDWRESNPSGTVFAANHSSVTWTDIYCPRLNVTIAEHKIGEQALNNFIGLFTDAERAKADSVNGTFNLSFPQANINELTVGSTTFAAATSNCSAVNLFNNNGYQNTNYRETILSDNTSVIFASILENDQTGFQGATNDFQMIVGVNQSSVRSYFFYAELT